MTGCRGPCEGGFCATRSVPRLVAKGSSHDMAQCKEWSRVRTPTLWQVVGLGMELGTLCASDVSIVLLCQPTMLNTASQMGGGLAEVWIREPKE